MKIEVPQNMIDKLMKKRCTEFNKIERDLKAKLLRRDNRIKNLEKEIEVLKGDLMDTSEGEAKRISDLAQCLVNELKRIKWVEEAVDKDSDWCENCSC